MSLSAFLYTLASVPMFAARPFLAAFITSLLARFGTSIPWIADHEIVIALSKAPHWFIAWPTLIALGLLSAGEMLAVKHSEVRAFMDEFDAYLKSAVAMLVAFALVDKETAKTLHSIQKAGFGFESLWSLVIGAMVYMTSLLRRAVFGWFADIDDHDDIGLQSLLNWMENSWTILGLLFLVIFPVVALVLSALTALALYLLRKRSQRLDLASRVPCAKCAALVYPHAIGCPVCRTPLPAPRAVGVFGQALNKPALDLERHRFELVGRKRCPVCATRLKQRTVQQKCEACGTLTFASMREFELYLDALSARLPRTLLICLALSAVPILGVVPGVIYYRLTLVSGLRGYVPPLRGCLTRMLVRVINFGIIALQPIPILGALIVPVMCLSSYAIYRRALVGRAQSDLRPAARAA